MYGDSGTNPLSVITTDPLTSDDKHIVLKNVNAEKLIPRESAWQSKKILIRRV